MVNTHRFHTRLETDSASVFNRLALKLFHAEIVSGLNTTLEQQCRYPFEEFMDHVRAMRTVRDWEYTQRFGHLGTAQNSRTNGARVVEYFADSYPNQKEAVHKAELFLSIYDYIGRNAAFFSRKGLVEELATSLFSVDPALLRAVHFVFTIPDKPIQVHHKRVWNLARAFKELAESA